MLPFFSTEKRKHFDDKKSFELIVDVIKALLPPKDQPQRQRRQQAHVVVKRGSAGGVRVQRRRCKSCSSQGKRTETIYECRDCPDNPGYCLNCCVISHK